MENKKNVIEVCCGSHRPGTTPGRLRRFWLTYSIVCILSKRMFIVLEKCWLLAKFTQSKQV